MSRAHTRGFALIELMVVLTVSAIMLALCAGLIHLLMKLDRSGRATSDQAADLARLARDFRADVHASGPIDASGGSDGRWTLSGEGGRQVEYLVRPGDLLRTVREAGKPRRFDLYRRPPRASFRIETEPEGLITFATLIVDRPPDARDDAAYHDVRIDAEVGKDLRIAPRPE